MIEIYIFFLFRLSPIISVASSWLVCVTVECDDETAVRGTQNGKKKST